MSEIRRSSALAAIGTEATEVDGADEVAADAAAADGIAVAGLRS